LQSTFLQPVNERRLDAVLFGRAIVLFEDLNRFGVRDNACFEAELCASESDTIVIAPPPNQTSKGT
jgi:hypothetical protein